MSVMNGSISGRNLFSTSVGIGCSANALPVIIARDMDCSCSKSDCYSDNFLVYPSNSVKSGIMSGRPIGGTAELVPQV